MADIKLICTSEKNVSITFTWTDFSPFHIIAIEGIYGIESNVVTSENTTTDGSTYQGATARERNILLTIEMDGNYRNNRELLYRCFPIKRPGIMEYDESGDRKTISYEVESIIPGESTGIVRDYTVSLKCPDPYFKDPADVEIMMAGWVADWEFPGELPPEGVEFGHKENQFVKTIENTSGTSGIGITTVFYADGAVTNPAIYHTESGIYTKIGYEGYDFTMQPGQYVVINTHTGFKNVYLLENIYQDEIEAYLDRFGSIDWDRVVKEHGVKINQYTDENGSYIQLQDGINTMTYTADEGKENLSVSVYYRVSYMGV